MQIEDFHALREYYALQVYIFLVKNNFYAEHLLRKIRKMYILGSCLSVGDLFL